MKEVKNDCIYKPIKYKPRKWHHHKLMMTPIHNNSKTQSRESTYWEIPVQKIFLQWLGSWVERDRETKRQSEICDWKKRGGMMQ